MRRQEIVRRLGGLLLLAGILAATSVGRLTAQTTTGTIRGFVKDQNGTALSGADVQATNAQTGVQRTATTRNDGSYVMPGLVPGSYNLVARHIGHSPQRQQIDVLIGATLLADFNLSAGAVELAPVVVQGAPEIETRTSEVATNVTQRQIQNLPTPSRNFLDLAALAPGVTISEDRINNGAAFRTFSAGTDGPNSVNLFIDGASLKNDLTGGGVSGQDASRGNPFPRNAIQEYRVITQNFKAEYQKASSAIITATTRTGSNTWTGNAFFGYQDKGLLALDTFQIINKNANPITFKKPDYTRYLMGLSAGGPLIRNRMFFFGSYEGNYQNRANTVNFGTIPTAFTALDTVNLRQYNGNFTSPFRETLLFGKVNYSIGPRSTAELSVNNRHETDVRDFGGQVAEQAAVNYRQNITLSTLKHSYFTGPWLNEASVTFERFQRNPAPNNSGLPAREFQNGSPTGCCTGIGRIGGFLSTQDFTQKRLGFRDDLTYTGYHAGGDHVFKTGVTVDFLTYDVIKKNDETPHFFYTDTIVRGNDTLGFNYRNPYQMVWQYGDPGLTAKNTQIGAYLQDDWSVTPQLTLNLGVRWDFETHMLNYDYVTPKGVRDTIRLYNSQLQHPIDTLQYFTDGTQRHKFYGAFQPRLGFSYALDHDSKTTLFGGFGLFYDRSLFDISVDETLKLKRPAYTVLFADPDSTPSGGEVQWNNNYLTTNPTVLAPLVASAPGSLGEVWLISNHAKVPKSKQWNIGIRHMFGDVMGSIAYTGVRGYDQLVFNWANFAWKYFGTDSSACCFGGSPFHGFTNILYTTSSGRTWYDAIQIQVIRPYRRTGKLGWGGGLAITNASRSVSDVDFPGDQFAFPQAIFIPKHPVNDERSRLVANWVVDVPYAYGVQFSGVVTLGSGQRQDILGRFDGARWRPGAYNLTGYSFLLFPGAWAYRNVDLRLRKDFPSVSGTSLGVTADLFNAFNYQNFGCTYGGTTPNCVVNDPRRLQVGAEYNF
ncbi:MAG: hypothetical protein DMD29_14145 [Gemmatimonadetes bacterium]|nr:MAG: hypothetical protein DMD29_14145 [Gemmatimonadota bacterium]